MDSVIELLKTLTGNEPFINGLLLISLKGSLLLLLALAVTKVLSSLSSAKKHFIWTVTFFILLLLPLFSFIFPAWELPLTLNNSQKVPEAPITNDKFDNDQEAHVVMSEKVDEDKPKNISVNKNTSQKTSNKLVNESDTGVWSLIYTLNFNTSSIGKSPFFNDRFLFILQFLWLTGVIILFFKHIFTHLLIYRVKKKSSVLDNSSWISIFSDIKNSYKILRPVKLLINDEVKSPMTWGVKAPKIVIPTEMLSCTEEKKRYALIHEFAHIKRMDLAIQLIAGLVCMIQWFNPLVWIAYKKMTAECEYACDDHVLKKCNNPSQYATLLLEVAESSIKWSYRSFSAITMAKNNKLEERIISILSKKNIDRSKLSLTTAFVTIIGISLLSVPLFAFIPSGWNSEESNNIGNTSVSALANDSDPSESMVVEQPEQEENRDSSTVAVLTEILYDDKQDVRLHAFESLGKIGTTKAIKSVLISLPRNKWNDLDEVVEIFNKLKNSYPLHILLNSIKDEKTDIRREAIFTLNDAPRENAVVPLCNYLDDENSEIKEEAAKGLGRIGIPAALECLTMHLKDDNENVRINVVEAIGKIQDKKAVPALNEALNDKSWKVREKSAIALGNIRDSSAVESLLSVALRDE